MQRAVAIVMLMIFGSFFVSPLLAAHPDPQSNLPVCCRAKGRHHCMMRMAQGDESTVQVSAVPEKCPYCPQGRITTVIRDHATAPDLAASVYAALRSHPACHAQLEARQRISFDRSRQKRGPPPHSLAG